MNPYELPSDLEYVRTTDDFDEASVPPGLLRAHRVADGVWARLVVRTGTVTFVFDDRPDEPLQVGGGGSLVIPPGREHHLECDGPAGFALEFYRTPSAPHPVPRTESTGFSGEPS